MTASDDRPAPSTTPASFRPFQPGDEPAALSLLLDWGVLPAGPAAHLLADTGSPCRWVAERAGELVGLAAGEPRPDMGRDAVRLLLVTQPDHRGTGIGRGLWTACRGALGTRPLATTVSEDDRRSRRFAEALGFTAFSHAAVWSLSLPAARPRPPSPAGLTILEGRDQPDAYGAFLLCCADTPDLDGMVPSYEEWVALVGPDPVSLVATLAGETVACCFAAPADAARWHILMTGVAPAHRGGGFGTAVKVELERRALRAGVRTLSTTTLVSNDPINALNRSLGYQRGRGWVHLRL